MRWGVVGTGRIVDEHMLPAIRAAGGAVRGICGADAQRRDEVARRHGVDAQYADIETLLADADVEVVYVAGHNVAHATDVAATAAAGRHVLCEKPIALSLEDADELVDVCERAGVAFGVNHALRGLETVRAMRTQLARGDVGQPLAVRVLNARWLDDGGRWWRRSDPRSGGVVLDITVHSADLVRYLLDDEFDVIAGFGSDGAADGVVEDAMAVARTQAGLLVSLHDAFTYRHAETGVEVHGEEGVLRLTGLTGGGDPSARLALVRAGAAPIVTASASASAYGHMVATTNAAVREGAPMAATGHDGWRSLAVALSLLTSLATCAAVTVPAYGGFPRRTGSTSP